MRVEIERKFLVVQDTWTSSRPGIPIVQGYLPSRGGCRVRVRLYGAQAFVTIKGPKRGLARNEFERPIPFRTAEEILRAECPERIEKVRHFVEHAGLVWEVDVFEGPNAGLVMAEVELTAPDQPVALPAWVGVEVSTDERYGNSYLARHPFRTWKAVA